MNYIDIFIVLSLGLALFSGYRRGLLRTILNFCFILLGIYLAFFQPNLVSQLMPNPKWRPVAGLVVIGVCMVVGMLLSRPISALLTRWIPFLGGANRMGGMIAAGILSLISIYFVLSTLVSFDTALAPFRSGTVNASGLDAVANYLAANPASKQFVALPEIEVAAQDIGNRSIPLTDLGQAGQYILDYNDSVRPQITGSILGPVVFAIGEHVPFFGRGRSWPT